MRKKKKLNFTIDLEEYKRHRIYVDRLNKSISNILDNTDLQMLSATIRQVALLDNKWQVISTKKKKLVGKLIDTKVLIYMDNNPHEFLLSYIGDNDEYFAFVDYPDFALILLKTENRIYYTKPTIDQLLQERKCQI